MRLGRASLAATASLLALAVPASAADFVVDDPGDAPGGPCDNDPATINCTLRQAVLQANATPGADAITFAPAITTITVGSTLTISAPVTIGQERDVTLNWTGGVDPLLQVDASAGGTTLRRLKLVRMAGTGRLLRVEASNSLLDRVDATGAQASGISIGGAAQGVNVQGVVVSGSGLNGIEVEGTARGVAIRGARLVFNGRSGVRVATGASQVTVLSSVIYGNGVEPISLEGSANGGIPAPSGLRIGPRQADGTLPLTGASATGGLFEIYRGDPFSRVEPALFDAFSSGAGVFVYGFPVEPAPGSRFALTVTSGGTSEFATVDVPADIASPQALNARAGSTREVLVAFSEPVDPATVDLGDFGLEMAGKRRTLTSATVSADGAGVVLRSSTGWKEGEAGKLDIAGPGAFADPVGNQSHSSARQRVGAGPGDFNDPRISRVKISPRTLCLSGRRRCRRGGATISFVTTEPGRLEVAVMKGRKRIGTRPYRITKAGRHKKRFSGKLRAGKIRPGGRYRMTLAIEDEVGNVTRRPPKLSFRVRR